MAGPYTCYNTGKIYIKNSHISIPVTLPTQTLTLTKALTLTQTFVLTKILTLAQTFTTAFISIFTLILSPLNIYINEDLQKTIKLSLNIFV